MKRCVPVGLLLGKLMLIQFTPIAYDRKSMTSCQVPNTFNIFIISLLTA